MKRWLFCLCELLLLFCLLVGCARYLQTYHYVESPSSSKTEAASLPWETLALEIPRSQDTTLRVRHRKGFSYGFSPRWRQSLWVAYQYVSEELTQRVKRGRNFTSDPEEALAATNDDYKNSGYDRGHLAPAADMSWDAQAMRESFYFNNN